MGRRFAFRGLDFPFARELGTAMVIVAFSEAVVMVGFALFDPPVPGMVLAVLDVVLLVVLSGILMLVLVVWPLTARQARERALQETIGRARRIGLSAAPLADRLGRMLEMALDLPEFADHRTGAVLARSDDGRFHMVCARGLTAAAVDQIAGRHCGPGLTPTDAACAGPSSPLQILKTVPRRGHTTCWCIPLTHRGKTLGILNLHPSRPLNDMTRTFLTELAESMGEMIAMKRIDARIEAGETLRAIVDHAPFGIWLSDPNGQTIFVNRTLSGATGLDPATVDRNDRVIRMLGTQIHDAFTQPPAPQVASRDPLTLHTTMTVEGRGPREFKVTRVDVRDPDGAFMGMVGIAEDVSANHRLQDALAYQSTHDPLTGALSRDAFQTRLAEACREANETGSAHALIFIDMDSFQLVNDTCGHLAGDRLLAQVAGLLSDSLALLRPGAPGRPEPLLARLGGDEFGLLLYGTDTPSARAVAEQLVAATGALCFRHDGRLLCLGASAGLVPFGRGNQGAAALLQQASSACYAAKEQGRGRVHLSEAEDSVVRAHRGTAKWVPRILQGLEENRFELFTQRIAPLGADDGRDHVEVLMRFRGLDGRLWTPGAFLGAAERFALMPRIDRWIIDHTLATLARHEGTGGRPLRVAINLSGQSLGEPWLAYYILSRLEDAAVDPRRVCFEITETAVIANMEHAVAVMTELKGAGCGLALDDFGSGLSSFAYLDRLPVDTLKIDGSLVREMVVNPVKMEMVAAINRVGHFMGLTTVAEWAEDEEILAALRTLGVDYAQGFAVGRPTPFDRKAHAA
ncbi:MAG: EAL domain-containing protein [Nitrospirae bacterium]|nr:EAL domain-containing protein [Nitrospirota bacterium]